MAAADNHDFINNTDECIFNYSRVLIITCHDRVLSKGKKSNKKIG